jgi:hypothetical protein
VAVEPVTEEAVLGVIDDWWRRAPASPAPLKAAQITLRLHPQVHRAADAGLLVPQVVGRIRDLARRGRIRALPDGSAVLSYTPLLVRSPAGSPPRDLSTAVGLRSGLPTWGTVPPSLGAPVAHRPAPPPAVRSPRTQRSRAVATAGHTVAADLSPRARRLIIRLAVVLFLLIATAVAGTVDRLIDPPIHPRGEVTCSESGRASSVVPLCGGERGR